MVPGGVLGGRGTLGGVGSSEGGRVGGGCEDSPVAHDEVPAGGLFYPCYVTPVGVVVPPVGRSGGQILHGDCGGYSCWDFFGVARYKGGG